MFTFTRIQFVALALAGAGLASLSACEGDDSLGDFGAFDAGGSSSFDANVPDASPVIDVSPPPTYKITGTIRNAVNAGLVLQQNGGDALTVDAGATTFSFATALHEGDAYAVTVGAFPQSQRCVVQNGTGTVGASDVTGVVIDCGNRASCGALLADFPGTPSGSFLVDPDGDGAIAPLVVDCDMTFDDGSGNKGWTLIFSTKLDGTGAVVSNTEVPTVKSGDAGYLGVDVVKALATVSGQVHIRSRGDAANQSVTSKPGTQPILNLRAGHILGFGQPTSPEQDWTGPYADAAHLAYDAVAIAREPGNAQNPNHDGCGAAAASCPWPAVYWAFNDSGMHFFGDVRMWLYGAAPSPLEIYVR